MEEAFPATCGQGSPARATVPPFGAPQFPGMPLPYNSCPGGTFVEAPLADALYVPAHPYRIAAPTICRGDGIAKGGICPRIRCRP